MTKLRSSLFSVACGCCLLLLCVCPALVFACTNECANDGNKQCGNYSNYSGYQVCSDYNSDGCFEWSGLMICPTGQSCTAGVCSINVVTCTPTTCVALSHNCGTFSDGCNGTLNCGTCASGQACTNGTCVTQVIASPSVDLKINGADGLVNIAEGGSVVISWSTTGVTSCAAFGAWSGNQQTSGLTSITSVSGNNVYSIACSGPGGLASDSVSISAVNSAPFVNVPGQLQVSSGESIVIQASAGDPDNDSLLYYWSCSAGNLSSTADLAPIYYAPTVSQKIVATCTLKVSDTRNHTTSKLVQISINPINANASTGTNTNSNTTTMMRAQLLAKIAQIQASIAALKQQLAAINNPTIATTGNGTISVKAQVGNVTSAKPFDSSVLAHGGDTLTFKIAVTAGAGGTFASIKLTNLLPGALSPEQNIKINSVGATGSLAQGLDLGGFAANQSKVVTFTVTVLLTANYQSFADAATATGASVSARDTVTINVQ